MMPAAKSENAHTAMMITSNQSVLGSLRNTRPTLGGSLGLSEVNAYWQTCQRFLPYSRIHTLDLA